MYAVLSRRTCDFDMHVDTLDRRDPTPCTDSPQSEWSRCTSKRASEATMKFAETSSHVHRFYPCCTVRECYDRSPLRSSRPDGSYRVYPNVMSHAYSWNFRVYSEWFVPRWGRKTFSGWWRRSTHDLSDLAIIIHHFDLGLVDVEHFSTDFHIEFALFLRW